MKTTSWTILVIGSLGAGALCWADDKQKSQTPNQAQQNQRQTREAYLGVSVEPIPPAMRSHMPDSLPAGQGVLVDQVAKDSPASKAGVQTHDILLSCGDQKLTSPEELVKMIRSAKVGQTLSMNILRGGKTTTSNVTLGERIKSEGSSQPQVYRFRPDDQFQDLFEEHESTNGEHGWKSFDAMKLTRTDEHHWTAEIEYRSKEGKKETRKFSGTREEIKKAIQNDKDLPQEEQHHLLRALNLHPPVFEFYFPSFGFGPPNSQQP